MFFSYTLLLVLTGSKKLSIGTNYGFKDLGCLLRINTPINFLTNAFTFSLQHVVCLTESVTARP